MRSTSRALWWHVGVTAAMVVFFVLVIVLTPSGTGFNFLVVVPGLAIVLLGLPWSLLSVFLAASYQLGDGPVVATLAYVVPALLNVILHAVVVARGRRRDAGVVPGEEGRQTP